MPEFPISGGGSASWLETARLMQGAIEGQQNFLENKAQADRAFAEGTRRFELTQGLSERKQSESEQNSEVTRAVSLAGERRSELTLAANLSAWSLADLRTKSLLIEQDLKNQDLKFGLAQKVKVAQKRQAASDIDNVDTSQLNGTPAATSGAPVTEKPAATGPKPVPAAVEAGFKPGKPNKYILVRKSESAPVDTALGPRVYSDAEKAKMREYNATGGVNLGLNPEPPNSTPPQD